MDSHFASVDKSSATELLKQIQILNQDVFLDGLMETVGGLLAVLNEHRQIIRLNRAFMDIAGLNEPRQALGLRPGEALGCVHANETDSGCGTTLYCSTCGSAKAIVSSLKYNRPAEDLCALKSTRDGHDVDLVLQVRSHPISIGGSIFLLLFMQDITLQQHRAALERTFFHDINNMLAGLVGASQLLSRDMQKSPMIDIIQRSSLRLQKAVEIQKLLLESETETYHLVEQKISVAQIRDDMLSLFQEHPARLEKTLEFTQDFEDLTIMTDISLFQRVLANMITNALEASEVGDRVRVSILLETSSICFRVHNNQVIPEDTKRRIFQRNFSTKGNNGRGVGTFSMKMFGEKILGGRIDFSSTLDEGTIFTFTLPL